jgi:hypothetical protein
VGAETPAPLSCATRWGATAGSAPKSAAKQEVIAAKSVFKRKLGTRAFDLNGN